MKHNLHRLYSLFTYALFFTVLSFPAIGQTPQYYSSGTGSNNSFPFNTSSSNKVQWIFIPAEFPGATPGMITKVYFKTSTTGTNKHFTDLTIKLGYTTASNTVTGPFATGLTTVYYEPSLTIASTTNGSWVSFTLQTPFYYDNTQNLLVEASTTGYTSPGFSVIQNSANGNKRIWGNVTSPTGTAGSGLVNFGFDILAYQDNAGVAGLVTPAPVFCFGSKEVKVTVKNTGSNVINSLTINWKVNGALQQPVVYNTPLAMAQTAIVSLGNFNFPVSKKQDIVVWTSDPNGNPDPENSDDTLVIDRTALDKPTGFILATGSTNICPGDSVLLHMLNGLGNITYQWQLNANDIPGATQNNIYAKVPGYYSVSLNNGACSATSNIKEVIVGPPVIDLGIDSHLCEQGHPFLLDAELPNATGYHWSTGAVTPQLDVYQSGTYWVEVTKTPGCVTSDTITLTFDPLPKVSGISYLQQGNTYQFSAGGLQHDVSYFWVFGDGAVSTDKSPVHTYYAEKAREVMFVVFNACGTDTAYVQLIPEGISTTAFAENSVIVYPNPAQNILHLDMATRSQAVTVYILNHLGQLTQEETLQGQGTYNIDISSLPAGSYILRLNDSGRMVNKHFEILR